MKMSPAPLPDGLADTLARQWGLSSGSGRDPRDVLADFLRLHLDALAADPAAGEILYGGAPDDETGDFDAALRLALKPLLDGAAGMIERGKAEKRFGRDINPVSAAVHYLGIAQMSFHYWMIQGRTGLPWETAEVLFRQFLATISQP